MTPSLNIALIQGSIRTGRFNDVITRWAERRLSEQGFDLHRIDPAAPDLLPLQTGDPAASALLLERLAGMDGFVIVTPEYNHSAPGALKTLIDAAKAEWEVRPVGFISYGGISGGLRAVEALRPVFAELHAVGLRDTVSFANPWNRFDAEAALIDSAEAKSADDAFAVFADKLEWWAQTLRSARLSTAPKTSRTADTNAAAA